MKWLRNLSIALLLALLAITLADLLWKGASSPDPQSEGLSQPSATSAVQPTIPSATPEPTAATPESSPALAATVPVTPTTAPPSITPTRTRPPNATATPELPATLTKAPSPTPWGSPATNATPTPEIPNAAIQFAAPGPLSRIISPLRMVATVRTVPNGSYRIELWAEPLTPGGEPRLLLREVHSFIANPIDWMFLDQMLEFELSRVSELAELRILTYDQFTRPVAAGSVELVLLNLGENQLTPDGDSLQPLVILEPRPNILIQGGTLIVRGLARPLDSQPLLIELVSANGTIVGFRQVFLTPDPLGRHIPFNVDVEYSVESPTWVRLILSQSGARIPGVRILNSVEVLLSP
jgi:hypothetical protein